MQRYYLGNVSKLLFNFVGFTLLGIGLFGFFTPGVPGTVFLIIALAAFTNAGNEKLNSWMLNHRGIGPILRAWQTDHSIPLGIKWISITCIVVFSAASIVTMDLLWARILIGVLALYGVWFVATRKTRRLEAKPERATLNPRHR